MENQKQYVAVYTAIEDCTETFEAANDNEALEKAKSILDGLYGQGFDYSDDVSIDIYELGDGIEIEDNLEPLMKLIHLIRHDKENSDRKLAEMLWDGMLRVWGED